MRGFKKFIGLALLLAMFSSTAGSADYYCTDGGGYGYANCRRAPCIAPAIALGTIALIAIIAVAVQNSSHGHGHCH